MDKSTCCEDRLLKLRFAETELPFILWRNRRSYDPYFRSRIESEQPVITGSCFLTKAAIHDAARFLSATGC
jgi:hypothetical protein